MLSDRILAAAAQAFDVRVADILSRTRLHTVSLARQTSAYLLRKRTHFSYPEIGRLLGQVDHTSAMAAFRRISTAMESDEVIASRVRAAEALLETPALVTPGEERCAS